MHKFVLIHLYIYIYIFPSWFWWLHFTFFLSNIFNVHVNYQWNEAFIFVMGPFEGLRCTRTVVEDCIVSNISPEAIISRIRGAGHRAVYGHLRYVSGDGFEGEEWFWSRCLLSSVNSVMLFSWIKREIMFQDLHSGSAYKAQASSKLCHVLMLKQFREAQAKCFYFIIFNLTIRKRKEKEKYIIDLDPPTWNMIQIYKLQWIV